MIRRKAIPDLTKNPSLTNGESENAAALPAARAKDMIIKSKAALVPAKRKALPAARVRMPKPLSREMWASVPITDCGKTRPEEETDNNSDVHSKNTWRES